MPVVHSPNALPTLGAMYITIKFNVIEIKDKTFISDGNSSFVFNVRESRKKLLNNAIYNAIKKEFPHRTVAAYNILIVSYYYEYYFNNYKVIPTKNGKSYEQYTDIQDHKTKRYIEGKYIVKNRNVGAYEPNKDGGKNEI